MCPIQYQTLSVFLDLANCITQGKVTLAIKHLLVSDYSEQKI
jgi:hypothetical protein